MTDLHGIDISKYQAPSSLDYAELTREQSFVVCRAAYGARSDRYFREHMSRLKEEADKRVAGKPLAIGAYTFIRQTQDWHGQLEAFVGELEAVDYGGDAHGDGDGYMLPVVDLEWNHLNGDGKIDPRTFNPIAQNILEALREHYGGAIAYLAPGFYQVMKMPGWLLDYDWWIAHYTSASEPWCPWKGRLPFGDWSIWQYSGKGRVDGASPCDMNRAKNLPLLTARPPEDTDDPIPDMSKNFLAWDFDKEGDVDPEELAALLEGVAERVRKGRW